jgi:hypothetical protein
MGETALDEDTFQEYLSEMKQQYTADKVSHSACSTFQPLITVIVSSPGLQLQFFHE